MRLDEMKQDERFGEDRAAHEDCLCYIVSHVLLSGIGR